MRAAALGDFIFMMRKDQILSATMDINSLTEMFFNHGRTFNMPTWTTLAPGTLPTRLTV